MEAYMKDRCLFGTKLIIFVAVIVIFILSSYQRKLNLNYIEQIHFQDEYLYYVDRGKDNSFRIIRSNAEGKKGEIIEYFRYKNEREHAIRQLFFNNQGEAYVLIEEKEPTSLQESSCVVFRCDFKRNRLIETEYDFTKCLQENHDIYIQGLREEELYFFETPNVKEELSEVKLCTMSKEGDIKELDYIPLDYPYLKTQFFLSENNIILWMDHNGEIFAKELGKDSYLEIEGISELQGVFKSFSNDNKYFAYAIDYESDCIRRINLQDQTSSVAYTAEEIRGQNPEFTFQNLLNPDCTEAGFCSGIKNRAEDKVVICSYQNGIHQDIVKIKLSLFAFICRMFPVSIGIIFVTFLIWLYWYIYCKYQVQTILIRLFLVFILGLFVTDHILGLWISQTIEQQLEKNQILALTILGEQLREHITENLEDDPDNFPLGEEDWRLNYERIGENNEDTNLGERMVYTYSILRADEDQNLIISESMLEYCGVPAEWHYSSKNLETLYTCLETQEYINQQKENKNGKCYNRVIPLVLSDDTVYGVLSVSVNGNLLEYRIWQYQHNLKLIFTVLFSVVSILLLLFLILFLRPLKTLRESAGRLASGELGIVVPVYGHDEISNISVAFNKMSLEISKYIQDIQEMSDGYYKFFPAKILELLGKESIQQVTLGDEITDNMTIFSMHSISDSKQKQICSAEKVYKDINQMLTILVAAITKYQGVVEHFEDAGLSALFTKNSREALDAAIEIHQSLDKLTYENCRTIAISYGKVMIGVIGYENRMEVATISVHSDLAKALRLKGDTYGARILITHFVYQQIAEFEKHYHARYLGNIYISGNDTLERIYDVYDGDNEEDFYYKELTKTLFEQGVALFVAKKFFEARQVFIQVLMQYKKDKAAKKYLYLCEKYYKLENTEEIETVIEHF